MFKYLWLAFIGASLIQPAMAQGNRVNCYFDHNEPYGCTFDESGTCFWNYGLDFCDTRFNLFPCRLAPNYDTCIVTVGCFWDNVNHWCDDGDDGANKAF